MTLDFDKGFGGLPKYNLTLETPITKLSLTGVKRGDTNVYMKREDLGSYFLGGNKVRFYEYLIPDILSKKTERIIAIGSSYSNNIRVVSAISQFLNIPCKLFIYLEKGYTDEIEGNLLLAKLCNAEIEFVHKSFVSLAAKEYISQKEKAGENCYFIPNGSHIPLAAVSYSDVLKEIIAQSKQLNIEFDVVFLPVGNGTTVAGLELGKEICGFKGQIIGLAFEGSTNKQRIATFIKEIKESVLNPELFDDSYDSNLKIVNTQMKYGEIIKSDTDFIKRLVRSDGICLDPIYNAHPFSVLMDTLEQYEAQNILYINTGGTPLLFLQKFKSILGD